MRGSPLTLWPTDTTPFAPKWRPSINRPTEKIPSGLYVSPHPEIHTPLVCRPPPAILASAPSSLSQALRPPRSTPHSMVGPTPEVAHAGGGGGDKLPEWFNPNTGQFTRDQAPPPPPSQGGILPLSMRVRCTDGVGGGGEGDNYSSPIVGPVELSLPRRWTFRIQRPTWQVP